MSNVKGGPRPDDLISKALEFNPGLKEFAFKDFRLGLERLCESVSEANLNPRRLEFFKSMAFWNTSNLLRVQPYLSDPAVSQSEISRPLFIVSLPRAGSTLLHSLISQDSQCRTLRFWEMQSPAPESPATRSLLTEGRIKIAEIATLKLYDVRHIHPTSIFAPEECNRLMVMTHQIDSYGFLFGLPSYTRWLRTVDQLPNYKFYSQLVRLLLWQRPIEKGGFIAFKDAIMHIENLKNIFSVFPDANIVFLSRDPVDQIGSMSSMFYHFRKIDSEPQDEKASPSLVGPETLEIAEYRLKKFSQDKKSLSPSERDRILSIDYDVLIADPVKAVRTIYEKFGYEFPESMPAKMQAWIAKSKTKKGGGHNYAIEDFGVTKQEVLSRLSGLGS